MTRTLHRSAIVIALLTFVLSTAAAVTATGPAQASPRSKPAATIKTGPALVGTLNLNRASEAQLRLLPGVGKTKAARIVSWRSKHGSFKRVKDLRRVKGFGRKTVRKLARYLSVTGETTLRKGR